MRSVVFGSLAVCVGLAAVLFSACADSSSDVGDDTAGEAGTNGGKPTSDAGKAGKDAGTDAGQRSTCEVTRAYFEACGEELQCGNEGFDAWCKANDEATGSETYRRAEAKCLTEENCDGLKRRGCEYGSYGSATPTDAQKKLVAAYCDTCDPSDVAVCTSRETTYNAGAGPKSVSDVFVAAWELADPLVDDIRAKCTGSALMDRDPSAGGDKAACLKAFGLCAGDLYIDKLPDCP